MTTLYELLGALPHDDAEGLRTAFRRAAKATHPDTNPDDPDASLRFRQLVRAHDILSDAEQRAAYDELLALAVQEAGPQPKNTHFYETIHKFASNTIAATIISGVLIASYALLGPISEAPAIPGKAAEAATVREPIHFAAITPAVQSDAVPRVEPHDAHEDTANPDDVITTGTVWPADGAKPIANIDLAPPPRMNDAKSYRARGIFAYRDGDLSRALADFDLAIQRDPNLAEAYVDRGIILYRMRQFARAFADMTKAKLIASARPAKAAAAVPPPRKISPVRVRDAAINIAASDRFLDVPSMQSMPSDRRR
jgi:curved DNA-binding protein CbpA